MADQYRSPKGTHDVLAPESRRWEALLATFAGVVERAGYDLIQSPMFEDVELFQRGMGEGTDVVRKEMYDFRDKSDRHLALRPEGTASVVRAYVQHRPPTPWKTWYAAPNFRYEQAQAGRYRQHHQVGVEAIGVADPDVDVEVITLLWEYLSALGLTDIELRINSMGDLSGRARYLDTLRRFLEEHRDELAPDDRDKIAGHPMRVLDSKRPESQAVAEEAPTLLDSLSDDDRSRLDRVQEGLTAASIPFTLDPRLVRGLDYYTHTTFEVKSPALDAAQNTIGGGGRYDALVDLVGGPPTPGIGFGSGIERTLLACDAEGTFADPGGQVAVFVIDLTGGAVARDLTLDLRRAGIGADRGYDQRSMKSQMKSADRSAARLALIVGDDEVAADSVTLRYLREARDQESVPRHHLIDHLRKVLS